MYNDEALLPLDKFEFVAKEYNKTLKARIFSADEKQNFKKMEEKENFIKDCDLNQDFAKESENNSIKTTKTDKTLIRIKKNNFAIAILLLFMLK